MKDIVIHNKHMSRICKTCVTLDEIFFYFHNFYLINNRITQKQIQTGYLRFSSPLLLPLTYKYIQQNSFLQSI